MTDPQAAFEVSAAASASKVMYTGALGAATGYVSSSTLLSVIGLLIAFAGFCVNVYYRNKQDQREEAEHQRRMRQRSKSGSL